MSVPPEINDDQKMEYQNLINFHANNVGSVLSKIRDFTNLLNSEYRLALLNCPAEEKENFLYILLMLKKSVKWVLEELGTSSRNKEYHFSCGACDENIPIDPNKDIWTSLQDHEHFEEMYLKLLNGELLIDTEPNISESESTLIIEPDSNSNTDSGIEQQEIEPTRKLTNYEPPTEENVNSFRFNFNLSYDEEIENKIYPSGMMQGIRKYDKVKEFTIMRAGNAKAVCMLCFCEMNGKRVTKHILVSHAMGQKHMRAASNPSSIELLQNFHDFWLKQDTPIQAHQVYFRCYDLDQFRCALCNAKVKQEDIKSHITKDCHKRRVMEMYENRINLYLLVTTQVQAYGVTKEQVEAKESEFRAREEKRFKERQATKKTSDSDTADEARNVSSKPESITHNIIRSVEKSESKDPLDLLPNRMKSDGNFLKRITKNNKTMIKCELCKRDLPDQQLDILKNHILMSPQHMALKKNKYSYFCEICNVRINNEDGWLSHNFSGPRHVNMAQSRKNKVTEYECTTCKTVIFGDELSLTRHLSIGNKNNRRERGKGLPEQVKKIFQSKNETLEQAALLASEAEAVINNSVTKNCCEKLETDLRVVFEHCKVYPFGSRISGLGNEKSDLDVFVDVGGAYYGQINQDPAEQVKLIRTAARAFKQTEYNRINPVLTARTPILKLHQKSTNLDCDLSFKHGLSVENTKFLRFCIQLQPICQQLILLVKKWASFINFECITTYAFAILCIFYFQVNGFLLSVESIRRINKGEHPTIVGWQTINYLLPLNEVKTQIKTYDKSLPELLIDFFKYYSKFDFNTCVICPLLGHVVNRSLFSEGSPENLPKEMKAYVAQLDNDDAEVFRSNSYMCIQDPFDLSHNLTKAAQQGTLTKFQNMCNLTLAHLEALK